MVKLNGQYQLSDYQAAQKLHVQRGQWANWINYFILGLLVLMSLWNLTLVFQDPSALLFVLVPLAVLGFWALFRFWLTPVQLKRVFSQQKELHATFEMELTDEAFQVKNDYGAGSMPWKDFVKWKENRDLFLLYRSDIIFNMVPKRLFSTESEIDYVRERLKAHGVPPASKVRNPVTWVIVAVLLIVALVVGIASFFASSAPR
jgi:hypothetical protein